MGDSRGSSCRIKDALSAHKFFLITNIKDLLKRAGEIFLIHF